MINDEVGYYAVLLFCIAMSIFLFFLKSRYQRDAWELNQDLLEVNNRLAHLNQKYEQIISEKSQLEQWAVQCKTQVEYQIERISEKDQEIHRLRNKMLQAEQNENELEQQINRLNERVGIAEAKSENLEIQKQQSEHYSRNKEQELKAISEQFNVVQAELVKLRTVLNEKQANFEAQQRHFIEVKQQLNTEFQHLAQKILEEKSQRFVQHNQHSLESLLKPFREQIEHFQLRVNQIHSESLRGTANLEAEIKQVLKIGLSMSEEAQNLTTALKGNNKIVGNWGEIQLETALQSAGLLSGEHYIAQESFHHLDGKRFIPDFVVRLPDNKHLIIDSKVSLIAYDQAVKSTTQIDIHQALDEHCRSIRTHIDGLSKKNYSALLGIKSPDFVLMFIPIEPAYIEAMKHDPQLFNFGYERNVILVSYTTLMPILRTVANLWRIERGNKEAQEIAGKAGEIYNQVCIIAERLSKLGTTLKTANNQYNQTVTSLIGRQGLLGKIERFQQLSNKANQMKPQIELLTNDIETEKLTLMIEKIENEDMERKENVQSQQTL